MKSVAKKLMVGLLVGLFGGAFVGALFVIVPRQVAEYKAREALAACDAAASHPSDPQRHGVPVADDKIALGPAITACELAVQLNPQSGRSSFQLGRVYWLARRDREALEQFVLADEQGHLAAAKYIGDAYASGRGLPPPQKMNDQQARAWYKKAVDGGFSEAENALTKVEDLIRRSKFDPSRFQYGDYMEALYSRDFDTFKAPIALAYYTQGIVKSLDDHMTVFMDKGCKPLLNIIGNWVINQADVLAILIELEKSKDRSAEENIWRGLRGLWDIGWARVYKDYGERDGIILFDEKIYGCDSPVSQQIVKNIMFRLEAKPR